MIPFIDLTRNRGYLEDISEAIRRTVLSGIWLNGKELDSFEKSFADYCRKKYCIGVSNGTDALEIALRSYDVGKGNEVITAVNTASPTAIAIINSGAVPRFIDCGDDYLIDARKIEKAITDKTKAIIPVHLYGQASDMDYILRLAEKYKLIAIEDCCQAHGTEYKGKRVPVGETGCFSFYPTKNLATIGDGGCIVTENKNIAERAKRLKQYGWLLNGEQICELEGGVNSRLSEINASAIMVGLEKINRLTKRRREIAAIYNKNLEGIVQIPLEIENRKHVYHLYVVRTAHRNGLVKYLAEEGIRTKIHYSLPLHLHHAFKQGYKEGDFPNAEKFSEEILSLPMFPELRNEEVVEICKSIKEFFKPIS